MEISIFTVLVCILFNLIFFINVQSLQIHKSAYIRKNFTNIVMQDKEIIRYKMRDYFGSSFSTYKYKMLDHRYNPPVVIVDENIVNITEPFSLYERGWFINKESTTPRKNAAMLLKIHEKNTLELTYLFYINEAYEVKIIDMTFYEAKKMEEIYSKELMPYFLEYLSKHSCSDNLNKCSDRKSYTVRDIHCNGLVEVEYNLVFMIPCRTKDDVQFIVWIILWRKADFFEVKIHLDNSELCTDLSGLQSISAFQDGVFAYIATSAYFYPDSICYSIYDLSYLNIGKVKHIATETYKFSDFNKSNSVVIPKDKFNIRDFLFFGVSPIFGKENGLNDKKHFLIATCYNHGLMFFQAINLISKQSSLSVCSFEESNLFMWKDYDICTYEEDPFNFNKSSISNVSISNISKLIKKQNYHTLKATPDIMYLNLTFIYKVNNLGKIFTESEYSLQPSTFTFFSSTSSPPIVYEFVIDEYLNVNTKRIYSVKDDGQRYTGNDMITVTQKFIAFLLFDNKMLRQSIRILYRDETNFGIGHTHILLDQFRADVSVIRFLSYKESDVIYVRNIEQWSYVPSQTRPYSSTQLTKNSKITNKL